jgi:MFS family permease
LIGARILQGVGAAFAASNALALITTTFPAGKSRNTAMGVYAAMGGVGATVGLLLGGVLTDALNWRWVFFPAVASRRIDAEAETDTPWHAVGRALAAQGANIQVAERLPAVTVTEFGRPGRRRRRHPGSLRVPRSHRAGTARRRPRIRSGGIRLLGRGSTDPMLEVRLQLRRLPGGPGSLMQRGSNWFGLRFRLPCGYGLRFPQSGGPYVAVDH